MVLEQWYELDGVDGWSQTEGRPDCLGSAVSLTLKCKFHVLFRCFKAVQRQHSSEKCTWLQLITGPTVISIITYCKTMGHF